MTEQIAVQSTPRPTRNFMTHRPTNRPLFLLCGVLLALFASACSSDQGGLPLGSGATARAATAQSLPSGAIYLTTHDGEVLTVDPARESIGVLWEETESQLPAFEVGPTADSAGLFVLLGGTTLPVESSLHEIIDGALAPSASNLSGQTICLSNHQRSEIPLAHEAKRSPDSGSLFTAVSSTGEAIDDPWVMTERNSAFCPRWTSQRDTVLTTAAYDESANIETQLIIERPFEQFSIASAGCVLLPMGVSPDDRFAAITALCLDEQQADEGLFLLDLTTVDSTTTFADLVKVADGGFGNGAWDPTGTRIATARSGDTPDDPPSLAILNIATGTTKKLTLPNDARVHTIAWLPAAVHG